MIDDEMRLPTQPVTLRAPRTVALPSFCMYTFPDNWINNSSSAAQHDNLTYSDIDLWRQQQIIVRIFSQPVDDFPLPPMVALPCDKCFNTYYIMHARTPRTPHESRSFRAWLFPVAILAVPFLAGAALTLRHHVFPPKGRAAETAQVSALPDGHGPVRKAVMTTVFWVGEGATGENDYISNVPSAWDGEWQTHYGGLDDPDHRSGYAPAKFTPRENPFYFALPYNDLDENGARKSTGENCLAYSPATDDHHSWCKNTWIAIVYKGKTVYAQWEDVGPNQEDDVAYVFGTAAPKNTFEARAGLDVSPAVRDYLGLDGDNYTTWSFIHANDVPDGPWKTHVTTSQGYAL